MEMCYDGALVMPSSYAVMSADEMMYVEGGDKPQLKAYGVYWHMTKKQVNTLVKAYNAGAGASALAAFVPNLSTPAFGLLSAALWAGGGIIDLMHEISGNKGLNLRVLWNGVSVITPF